MIENFIESDDEIVITKFYENNEGMEYKPFDFSFSIKKDEVKKIYFKDGAIYIWDNQLGSFVKSDLCRKRQV